MSSYRLVPPICLGGPQQQNLVRSAKNVYAKASLCHCTNHMATTIAAAVTTVCGHALDVPEDEEQGGALALEGVAEDEEQGEALALEGVGEKRKFGRAPSHESTHTHKSVHSIPHKLKTLDNACTRNADRSTATKIVVAQRKKKAWLTLTLRMENGIAAQGHRKKRETNGWKL